MEVLEKLTREMHDIITDFGGAIKAVEYVEEEEEDRKSECIENSDYIQIPSLLQLFSGDEEKMKHVERLLLDSKLIKDRSHLETVHGEIQAVETLKATNYIQKNGGDENIEAFLQEHGVVKRDDIILSTSNAVARGSSAIISFHSSREYSEKLFAVKRYNVQNLATNSHIRSEAIIWSSLSHENILPLYGYCIGPGDLIPSLVTLACPDESIDRFLDSNAHKNESKERRLCFLRDIAAGLTYLHEENVIHGDLRAANVLVYRPRQGEFRAMLCDFGLSSYTGEVRKVAYKGSSIRRTSDNWLAPELLFAPESTLERVSKEGDVYAFGCVFLEVMYGMLPYRTFGPFEVREAKEKAIPPAEKEDVDSLHWPIVDECWNYNKALRPAARFLLSTLKNLLKQKGIQ